MDPGEGSLLGEGLEPGEQAMNEEETELNDIAEKVAKVLPLVYWNWQRRGELVGQTTVVFKLNADGYVDQSSLSESSGDPRIDQDSGNALLLASPFDYEAGWIKLTLVFHG